MNCPWSAVVKDATVVLILSFFLVTTAWILVQCGGKKKAAAKPKKQGTKKGVAKQSKLPISSPAPAFAINRYNKTEEPKKEESKMDKIRVGIGSGGKKTSLILDKEGKKKEVADDKDKAHPGKLQYQSVQTSIYIRRGTSAWIAVDHIDESEFSFQLRSADESTGVTV